MRQTTAETPADQGRSTGPLFWIAVDNKRAAASSPAAVRSLPEPAFDSGNPIDLEEVAAWWHDHSEQVGLPDPTLMNSGKFARLESHSIIADVVEAEGRSGNNLMVRQIGEAYAGLLQADFPPGEFSPETVWPLLERLQGHLAKIFELQEPVGFELPQSISCPEGSARRGVLLPFGSTTITAIMAVIEQSTGSAQKQGADVLNLEETLILDEEENSDAVTGSANSTTVEASSKDKKAARRSTVTKPGDVSVTDLISDARNSAEDAREAEERSRKALYAALSRSYDLALCAAKKPEEFAAQLVFGPGCSKRQLADYVTILEQARSRDIEEGELGDFLESLDDGIASLIEEGK